MSQYEVSRKSVETIIKDTDSEYNLVIHKAYFDYLGMVHFNVPNGFKLKGSNVYLPITSRSIKLYPKKFGKNNKRILWSITERFRWCSAKF